MGSDCARYDGDNSYKAYNYKSDSEIPFAPDGNAPLISNCVERVKGISGRFKDLRCVRKTVIVPTETDSALRNFQEHKLEQEAKILYFARHYHVIRLVHTYFEGEAEDRIKFAIIMDRADSNLQDYLKPGRSINKDWFGCLISVVRYIHTLGIRHRDIKPSNILIKEGRVLLADFGISQMGLGKTMPSTYQNRNAARSREYCAPEVDKGRTRGRSADIFSLGAVFLEMLVANNCPDQFEELNRILKPLGQQTSSYARQIDEVRMWIQETFHLDGGQSCLPSYCQRMLHPERDERPSAEELESASLSLSTIDAPITCECVINTVDNVCARLIEACQRGSDGEVKGLLSDGADPNTLGAIHHAAERGSRRTVQALLDAGALVDSRNPVEQTALQCAARNGFVDIVKLLLDNGANVNAADENNQTALHGAAGQGYEKVVRLLLNSKAEVDTDDLDGQTAIQFAARRRHYAVVDLLKQHSKQSL